MNDRSRKIAAAALHLAQKGDLEEAATYAARLSGSDDLIYAMIAWIDTFIAIVYPGHRFGDAIAITFLAIETGDVGTADDVDPAKAWAGRLISYRAADDAAGFNAVLQSLPDGRALGDGVMALLAMVAMSINHAEEVRRRAAEVSGGSA